MTKLYVAVLAACAVAIGSVIVFGQGSGRRLAADDYLEIQELYAQYNHTIDTGDSEGWVALFTPDGVFQQRKGREQLMAFATEWKEKRRHESLRHFNSNMSLKATPEGAEGVVYLMGVDISARPPVLNGASSMYVDALVKTSQGWRFKSRIIRRDGPTQPPSSTAASPR